MPRRRRQSPRKRKRPAFRNIREWAADFFGWPWFGVTWFNRWNSRKLVHIGLICAFWVAVLVVVGTFVLSLMLPDINKAVVMEERPIVVLRDRNGKEFARLGDIQGDLMTVKEMSPHLINAVLSIEDRRFYKHFGVDPFGLARAVWNNVRGNRGLQGGSTITQQLAKNLFLTPERTLTRKAMEALLAIYLERQYTKDEILAAYLNRAYFGAGAYGVDSAARVYFNTSARNLTLEQSAMLAGLLKAPSRYSPDNNPELTLKRTKTVIAAMVDAGYLRPGAEKMKIAALPKREYNAEGSMDTRYFTDWIMTQVEGYIGTTSQNLVIDTTLDADLQRFTAQTIRNKINQDGEKLNVTQGAAIILGLDGGVATMIGGKDYAESQYNRAFVSRRQPGSSFKPFVYIAALEAGYTPDSIVVDEPIRVGKYAPGNYDGKYRGQLRLADAVALSLNSVAVRTMKDVGISKVKRVAQRMGITDPLTSDLSLALGASEVGMLPLTAAYATLANRGLSVEPYGIKAIRTPKGEFLYQRRSVPQTPVLDSYIVAEMNTMLQGVVLYGTGQGAMIDRPSAGKTGTTSNHRDAWFMGFTADYAAGVWVGNDDNSSMKKVTGGAMPAQIWRDIMMAANRGHPVRALQTMATYNGGYPTQGGAPNSQGGGNSMFDNLISSILGDGPPAPVANNPNPQVPVPAHRAIDPATGQPIEWDPN